jgi:hypothetical protein
MHAVASDVAQLVENAAGELAPLESAIRSHPFLAELEAGTVRKERLRVFVSEQFRVLASDRRSFAQLAARFPEEPSGSLFLAMAGGESEALARLQPLAAAVGLDAERVAAYEPRPGCQAYPAFVAWLALNGSRLDVALAFLVNLDPWGGNCARMRGALADVYRVPADALGFFDFFAVSAGLRERISAVADAGLEAGDSPAAARRAARLLQAYELAFWDALGEPA